MVISLWSGPRSISTALMYSMAQRSDMRVLDEPLYAHFLRHTGAERPCREATLAGRPSDSEAALAYMTPKPEEWGEDRHLFCKHIANNTLGTVTSSCFATPLPSWPPTAHTSHAPSCGTCVTTTN